MRVEREGDGLTTDRSNQAAPRSPRQGRVRGASPTRAQIKAMQARSIVLPVEPGPGSAFDGDSSDLIAPERSAPERSVDASTPVAGVLPRRTRSRSSARVLPLPRHVEFAYIRSDMRRLLAIAGMLAMVMLALLVVVGR